MLIKLKSNVKQCKFYIAPKDEFVLNHGVIIDLDKKSRSFVVRNYFNPDVVHTSHHSGKVVTFKREGKKDYLNLFLEKIGKELDEYTH